MWVLLWIKHKFFFYCTVPLLVTAVGPFYLSHFSDPTKSNQDRVNIIRGDLDIWRHAVDKATGKPQYKVLALLIFFFPEKQEHLPYLSPHHLFICQPSCGDVPYTCHTVWSYCKDNESRWQGPVPSDPLFGSYTTNTNTPITAIIFYHCHLLYSNAAEVIYKLWIYIMTLTVSGQEERKKKMGNKWLGNKCWLVYSRWASYLENGQAYCAFLGFHMKYIQPCFA